MSPIRGLAEEHVDVSRRYFLQLGAAGAVGLAVAPLWAQGAERDTALERLIGDLEYLTPPLEFTSVERGDPLPYTLPLEKRREVGLERDTWKLEVIADPEQPTTDVRNPLTKANGRALTFADLVGMGKEHGVRFLKVMTCNNIGKPLGMGLWEGVPLRHVIWKARPASGVRRVFYYGYHNDDPKQMFRSSLPIGRVLEDPPAFHPVILAYKLNGDWLPGVRGGPVRMLVPDAYGFKSVKWLTTVVLSDLWHANDSYATMSPNDIDSAMKTFARFLAPPEQVAAAKPFPLTGMAQVGMSGLSKVQYWVAPAGAAWPENDSYFTGAPWKDAEILPPPGAGSGTWGGGLPGGELPDNVLGFHPASPGARAEASRWPMRWAMAHWAVLAPALRPGRYTIRCRTIDANGVAQPMPRPFRKSGRNAIQDVDLLVKA